MRIFLEKTEFPSCYLEFEFEILFHFVPAPPFQKSFLVTPLCNILRNIRFFTTKYLILVLPNGTLLYGPHYVGTYLYPVL